MVTLRDPIASKAAIEMASVPDTEPIPGTSSSDVLSPGRTVTRTTAGSETGPSTTRTVRLAL